METLPISFYDAHTHGELMSRYTNDTDALRQMISSSVQQEQNEKESKINTDKGGAGIENKDPEVALAEIMMMPRQHDKTVKYKVTLKNKIDPKSNTNSKNNRIMSYNLPQRKSPRARWHDYTGADYFVTFCTKNREFYFGDVVNGKMELSEIGKWAVTQIEKTAIIRQNDVKIPSYVVMPNHVHLLLTVDEKYRKHNIDRTMENKTYKEISLCKSNLAIAIGGIKEKTTKFAKRNEITFAWQPRFYDSKITDNDSHYKVFSYITNNVVNWKSDCFHPDNDDGNW